MEIIRKSRILPGPAARFDRRAIPPGAVESVWRAADGHAIRRIDWAAAAAVPGGATRGALLFLPGRGDIYEKYLETLAHWQAQGWAVTAIDWRGQAGSGRHGLDAVTGHIADFSLWLDDLAAFWRDWTATAPTPCVVIAHSMGGHLGLRALAERRIDPAAMVLTTPMLGMGPRGVPARLLHGLARLLARLGDARRPAWRTGEVPGTWPADRINLLTHDADRYADEAWWHGSRPELRMGPASWGWVERAYASTRALARPGALEGVDTPVLLFAAMADRLVSPRAIVRAAARLRHGELIRLDGDVRHEILRESDAVRDGVLVAIDAFLDRVAP